MRRSLRWGGVIGVAIACTLMAVPAGALAIGSMTTGRDAPAAVTLANGQVLVVGGIDPNGNILDTAELFDPTTGTFSATTGTLATPRAYPAAALLPDGDVLVAGGEDNSGPVASAELFDPATGTFSPTAGSMTVSREGAAAAPLPDGDVLIAGGYNSGSTPLASAELYDPATETFSSTGLGQLPYGVAYAAAAPLPDGDVLIAGGALLPLAGLQSAELFDPTTDSFSSGGLGSMAVARYAASAAPLPGGEVLIVGGGNGGGGLSGNELFDPVSGTFTTAGVPPLGVAREFAAAATLQNGQVLVVGGDSGNCGCGFSGSLSSAELVSVPQPLASMTGGAFGGEPVGIGSGVQTITVADAGAQALTISGASIAGADAGDFTLVSDACGGQRLQMGQSCSIGVRFTPSATGSRTATLALQDNEATPAQIALSGTGIPTVTGPTGAAGAAGSPGPAGPRGPAGGELSLRQVRSQANGTVTLSVVVPGAGQVNVLETAWKSNFASAAALQPAAGRFAFARAHANARRASTLRLVVRPSASGRRLVRRHRYPVTLRLWVTYTAANGARPQNLSIYGLELGS